MCANRTPRSDRARQRGKSDTLDSERIARETLAHPLLPKAFKRAGQDSGPDELHELLALWHNQRRSILASRQHLLNEAETMLSGLPLELREHLPDSKAVRPRLGALRAATAAGALPGRQRCGWRCSTPIGNGSRSSTPKRRLSAANSPRSCRRTARRSASSAAWTPARSLSCWSRSGTSAASPKAGSRASTGPRRWQRRPRRGPGEPVRHRYNPGGNRRVNAILYRMAITQLRCEPRAQRLYAQARANGHTKKEARRILKRHLSDVGYRRMIRDLPDHAARPLLAA